MYNSVGAWITECAHAKKASDLGIGPKVFQYGIKGNIGFLVEEYIPGITLAQAAVTKEIIWTLLDQLNLLGKHGVCHGDSNWSNYIVSEEGGEGGKEFPKVALVDFGSACDTSDHRKTAEFWNYLFYRLDGHENKEVRVWVRDWMINRA
jgi:predicted unusual protein kinase regulating ubiquinone biosynthesis (AarF/ABC1/UbiB family)